MKSFILSFIGILGAVFACVIAFSNLNAKAADEFGVRVDIIQASEANSIGNGVQAGDRKVTLYIDDASDCYGGGFGFQYDAEFTPICLSVSGNIGDPVYDNPNNLPYQSVLVSLKPTQRNFGVAFSIDYFSTPISDPGDGETLDLIAFYLHPINPNTTANPVDSFIVAQWDPRQYVGQEPNVIDYTIPDEVQMQEIAYFIADLNGDGIVNATDANMLSQVISQYGSITEANFGNQFSGMSGVYYDGIAIFGVVDVNGDGVVNSSDTAEILYCFNCTILEADYYGNAGTWGRIYVPVAI